MKSVKFRSLEGFIYKIGANEIRLLAENLKGKYDVYGPVKTHDEAVFSKYRFKHLEAGDKLELHYPITPISPTKYFFPARETLLEFSKEKIKENKEEIGKSIIFGLDIFDLLGINLLDKEFSSPVADEKYLKNRENMLLLSIDTMDPPPKTAFDIHFKKIAGDEYEASPGSNEGKRIIKDNQKLFKKKDKKSKIEFHPKTSPIHHPKISEIVEKSKNDPIWDKLAEKCFGCGICTYVCPVCYCFEVEDKVKVAEVTKCAGCRERRWDSCMLPDFASISCHDFRPLLRDRIYNWHHHKFVRTPKEHGQVGCVDCDRCIVYCPARINFHETLQYLIKKYS